MGSVSWDWTDGQKGGDAGFPGRGSAQIIYSVFPYFHFLFNLRDVLQSFGEPTHVIAIARQKSIDRTDLCYETRVVYLPQGLMLQSDCFAKPDLKENTLFAQVVFFVPGLEGLRDASGVAERHPDWVLPWQGFKGFDFYCRDEWNGQFCRGVAP